MCGRERCLADWGSRKSGIGIEEEVKLGGGMETVGRGKEGFSCAHTYLSQRC